MKIVINKNIDAYSEGLKGGYTPRMIFSCILALMIVVGNMLLFDVLGWSMVFAGMLSGIPAVGCIAFFCIQKEGYYYTDVIKDRLLQIRTWRVNFSSVDTESIIENPEDIKSMIKEKE